MQTYLHEFLILDNHLDSGGFIDLIFYLIHNFLAHKILAIYIVCACASKTLTTVMRIASFVII
jgi:hypothetical protein